MKELSAQVEQAQTMISQLLNENEVNDEDAAVIRPLYHSLSVFRIEMLAQLKDWGAIRVAVTVRSSYFICGGCLLRQFIDEEHNAVKSGVSFHYGSDL